MIEIELYPEEKLKVSPVFKSGTPEREIIGYRIVVLGDKAVGRVWPKGTRERTHGVRAFLNRNKMVFGAAYYQGPFKTKERAEGELSLFEVVHTETPKPFEGEKR